MKYWVFDGKQARGPYEVEQLKAIPGFGPDTVIAPDGASSAEQWRAAQTFDSLRNLFSKPPPLPRALPEPTPTSRTSVPIAGSPDVKISVSHQPVQAKELGRESHKARWLLLAVVLASGVFALAYFKFVTGPQAVRKFKEAFFAKDYANALVYGRPLAEHGNSEAQTALGEMYQQGKGVPPNYAEALKWYQKSADQGNAEGAYDLATMYYYGQGVAQNYPEAVKWLRESAEKGLVEAQADLSAIYRLGKGVPQDYAEALKWAEPAAVQGNAVAQLNFGALYFAGQGVAQNRAKGLRWIEKAAAQGNQDALYILEGLGPETRRAILFEKQ